MLRTQIGKDTRKGRNWEVLITTYNLAVGDVLDKKFFRKVPWNVSTLDTAANRYLRYYIILDLRIRRRAHTQELPVATIHGVNADRGRMEATSDGDALAK